MTEQHTYLFTVGGVSFYEHGEYGDEHPLMAKVNGVWVSTFFWDKPDIFEVADWLEDLENDQTYKSCGSYHGTEQTQDCYTNCAEQEKVQSQKGQVQCR